MLMLRYIIGIICIVGALFLFARHVTIIRFLAASSGDAIFGNIYINDIRVGGLLKHEADAALLKAAALDKQVIRFIYKDSLVYSWTFVDFGAKLDFSILIEEAFLYGRTGTQRERYAKLRALEDEPYKINGEPLYSYDEAAIPKRLEAVRTQASILPVNASMRIEDGSFIISEGKPGRTPNMQAAAEQLKQILAAGPSAMSEHRQIELEMQAVPPAYNAGHFSRAQSLLGRFSTLYSGGDENPRSINIRLAASLINNTVVLPGETFSTREAVGPVTAEKGYALAAVIVDGQLVEDYGGGLCQLASTLYNAVLFAELPVVERANHSLKVYYMDFGFDAAIAGDYMDLKFKNNTGYPVLVAAGARDAVLEVRIYGHETRPANRTLAFVSERVEVIPAEPERVIVDESLPSGYILVNTEPQDGFKYELFRIVFIDGEQVGRERVNVSVYRPIQGVIRRGPEN